MADIVPPVLKSIDEQASIHFRPHHFLCALCFQGKGYSPTFIANFAAIMSILTADENTSIKITSYTDSICQPCPHRKAHLCTTQEKITKLDQAHAQVLSLTINHSLTWAEAKQRIRDQLTLDQFHQICHTCEWKQYGICEAALKDFLE